jgi:hypothetical protein
MTAKLMNALNCKALTQNNIRMIFFVVTLVLFILGAGAPGDGGGLGGH